MGFPENILDTDERVVRSMHPHWITLVRPLLWLVAILVAAGWAISIIDNSTIKWIIVAVALIILSYTTLRPVVTWVTSHFVFTTHRVLTRTGLLHRQGRDVPLARINDVAFSSTLFERVVRCGTLTVESAGERGQIVLKDVPSAEKVQGLLYRLIEDDAERRASLHHPPQTPGTPQTPPPNLSHTPPSDPSMTEQNTSGNDDTRPRGPFGRS